MISLEKELAGYGVIGSNLENATLKVLLIAEYLGSTWGSANFGEINNGCKGFLKIFCIIRKMTKFESIPSIAFLQQFQAWQGIRAK